MVRKYVVGPLNVALGWDPETLSLIKEKTLTWVDGRILVWAIRKKKECCFCCQNSTFVFIYTTALCCFFVVKIALTIHFQDIFTTCCLRFVVKISIDPKKCPKTLYLENFREAKIV